MNNHQFIPSFIDEKGNHKPGYYTCIKCNIYVRIETKNIWFYSIDKLGEYKRIDKNDLECITGEMIKELFND